MSVSVEIVVVAALIVVNGVFAMAEMALVAARKLRLQRLAATGHPGAQAALELANAPDRFLPTVQVGVTLIGVLAGAFGGATIAETLAARLTGVAWLAEYREAAAVAIVVAAITFATIVLGELVPKRLALGKPERFAVALARPMRLLSSLAAPVVRLLGASTRFVLWLLRAREPQEVAVSEEEIRLMIAHGAATGILHEAEHTMVENIFRLGDRRVSQLMTPRSEIAWLDVEDPATTHLETMLSSGHSNFPVCQRHVDVVLGVVSLKDVLPRLAAGGGVALPAQLRQPLFVGETTRAVRLPELLRRFGTHIAIVIDEYGGVQGLVTLDDLLTAVVGALPEVDERPEEPEAVQREDGSWLVDGLITLARLRELVPVGALPGEERGDFETLAGFLLTELQRVPRPGDHTTVRGVRLEVVDMDGHRIDKVLITPVGRGARPD
jgi:putative hemolysin